MLAATDWAGIALVVTAAGAFLGSLGAFIATLPKLRHLEHAIETKNGQPIGALAEQNAANLAQLIGPDPSASVGGGAGLVDVPHGSPPPPPPAGC